MHHNLLLTWLAAFLNVVEKKSVDQANNFILRVMTVIVLTMFSTCLGNLWGGAY